MTTVVRPARPSDKAPLMEFISRIWGGHDYIPRVWEEWLRDRSARTLVVEVDGKPVGMNRVKFLEDGSAWLEGARIHPDFRGKGLASALGKKAIQQARERGITVVRLATSSRNSSAIRQIGKMGLSELARMSVYSPRARSRFSPQRRVRLATRRDTSALERTVRESKEFEAGGGVFWEGFRAMRLTRPMIGAAVRGRHVYLSGGGAAFVKKSWEGDEPFVQVSFACGDPEDVTRLIRHVFGRNAAKRKLERFVCAPQGSPLVAAAKGAGLARWASFILFQRNL